jgi:hypothetical protein
MRVASGTSDTSSLCRHRLPAVFMLDLWAALGVQREPPELSVLVVGPGARTPAWLDLRPMRLYQRP